MKYPGFCGGTYQSTSLNADAQQCMNLYPEVDEGGGGKNSPILVGTPGHGAFGTLPTSPNRGLWGGGAPLTTGSRLFAVGGSKSYEVDSSGSTTLLGDVGNDGKPVQMFPNGTQLLTISNGQAWIDNGSGPVACRFTLGRGTVSTVNSGGNTDVTRLSGTPFDASIVGDTFVLGGTGFSGGTGYVVASVTDDDHLILTGNAGANASIVFNQPVPGADGLVTAASGAFLDGYFIVARPDSKQFNISAINDGTLWNPLDSATKEGYPDNIGMLLADHEELWIFGESTTEVWRNEGNPDFPLQRDPGAFIHQGIAAPATAVKLNNGVAWLGGDERGKPVAWRAEGFQPVRISTHAIETAWQGYSTVLDAVGYVKEEAGHIFWVITFPTADATWVYDATTKLWHQEGSWNGSANGKSKAAFHQYVFGKHIVADYSSGVMYQSSLNTYTDAGTAIHRIRVGPYLTDEDAYLFFSRFRLDMENSGAVNPSMEYSDDGGHTWSTARTTTSNSVGKLATYDYRRLGRSKSRIFRVTVTAALKIAIIDAYVEVTSGIK